MVEIDVIDTTIRAVDRVDNVTEVETVGWDEIPPSHSFSSPLDGHVGGRVTSLSMTASFAQLEGFEDGERVHRELIDPDEPPIRATNTSSLLAAEGPITIHVRFDGPARIEHNEGGTLAASFEQPTAVTIGFESHVSYPREAVTIPRTTDGVATAITYFSASLLETDLTRSIHANQRHPPRILFGNAYDVPEAVDAHVPDTGVELVVPDRLAYLFPAAPLAYYLGLRVITTSDETPHIRTADGSVLVEFEAQPTYQYEIASLLRRVFLVESLVRYDQISTSSPADVEVLPQLDINPESFVEASVVDRLTATLETNFAQISDALPEWHYVSYVDPTFENARALPYLVRNLAAVMGPEAAPGRGEPDGIDPANWCPKAVPSRVIDGGPHGSALAWIGSAPPPSETLFVPDPDGYEQAPRYLDHYGDSQSVTVVCNDGRDRDVRDAVADVLERFGPDSLSLDVRSDVHTDELYELFEAGVGVLYFIGDGRDGFSCPDGTVDPNSIGRSNVRLVVLDGAEGYETGLACVRRGSEAGIVRTGETPTDPTDAQTLLGLLTRGFTIDQATRYTIGSDGSPVYRALGDAFSQFTQSMKLYCTPATIESIDAGQFHVHAHLYIPKPGFIWRPGLDDVPARLCAQPFHFSASGPKLATLVGAENVVPIVDDEIHWRPDEPPFYPFA
ncbi:hypothetical protein [Halovivax gelatinilyticus]|uniref:hypothetical protein n=1 Tax=Halovivax gelatinilyticus TaxID=2961597 RepID=UPI0020CA909C|nr:hypothetical protein [Halovivax gelatinilyticus]